MKWIYLSVVGDLFWTSQVKNPGENGREFLESIRIALHSIRPLPSSQSVTGIVEPLTGTGDGERGRSVPRDVPGVRESDHTGRMSCRM